MVKKKWIDKSKATTFTLTRKYVDSDEEDGGAPRKQQGGAQVEEDMDPELAELFGMASIYDDTSYELSEERRQAILEFGLPDDGYDYLRHLRAAGPQQAGGLMPLSSNQADASQQPSTSAGLPTASAAANAPSSSNSNAAFTSTAVPVPRTAADIAAEVLAAAPDGPSVHIDAPRWAAPPPDVRLVDARALSLAEQHAKRQDELSALEAAASVSAFSRTADAKLAARGRLAAELAELEAAMRAMEEEEERVRYQHSSRPADASSKHAKSHASHHHQHQHPQQQQQHPQQQQQQQQQHGPPAQEEVEEDAEEGDWDEWMDQFVVTATAPSPAPASYSATRALQPAHEGEAGLQGEGVGHEGSEWEVEEDSEEGGGESEDDVVGPLGGGLGTGLGNRGGKAGVSSIRSTGAGGSSRSGSVAGGGVREGSIASSYWRDERCDRRDTLDVIDQRFEHVALQYEDGDMGELDEEVAERARGTADISAFGNVLQEFLDEQAQLESEQGPVPPADRWEGVDASTVPVLADMDDGQFEAWMQRKQGTNASIAGTAANRKVEAIEDQDLAVIAAVKARIAAVAARMEAQGCHPQGGDEEVEPLGPEGRKVVVEDRGERWDCESVLSLRSNLENHPRKIVESAVKPQSRTGSRSGPAITLSAKTGMPVSSSRAHGQKGSLAAGSIPEEEGEQGPAEAVAHGTDSSDKCSGSGSSSDSDREDAASVAFSIATTARQKGESAEERRARKNAVKELRRASRASKRELKGLFKAEAGKQKRQAAGKAAAGGARGGSTFVIP